MTDQWVGEFNEEDREANEKMKMEWEEREQIEMLANEAMHPFL